MLDIEARIRNRVKELRTARNWTQQELAEAVGVSRQSINAIERDRYVPSLELALTFAKVFSSPDRRHLRAGRIAMRFFRQVFDERLREHRRRSTAIAGIVSCLLAVVLFEYFLLARRPMAMGPAVDRSGFRGGQARDAPLLPPDPLKKGTDHASPQNRRQAAAAPACRPPFPDPRQPRPIFPAAFGDAARKRRRRRHGSSLWPGLRASAALAAARETARAQPRADRATRINSIASGPSPGPGAITAISATTPPRPVYPPANLAKPACHRPRRLRCASCWNLGHPAG